MIEETILTIHGAIVEFPARDSWQAARRDARYTTYAGWVNVTFMMCN